MGDKLHRYTWDGRQFCQDIKGEWVKFTEACAALESEQGLIRLVKATLEDQRLELRGVDMLKADNATLRGLLREACEMEQSAHRNEEVSQEAIDDWVKRANSAALEGKP